MPRKKKPEPTGGHDPAAVDTAVHPTQDGLTVTVVDLDDDMPDAMRDSLGLTR